MSLPIPKPRLCHEAGHGGLVVRSRLRGRRGPGLNPILLDIRCLWDLLHARSYAGDQTISRWCDTEIWRGTASSGVVLVIRTWLKIRRTSQNSPRVASKRDVTTKRKTKTAKRPSVVFEASW
ncbi:hypothetical protein AVEN_147923-1 [Araneus ventricosus]|uniref:Uncharacterized protein n=1 Tax=Araneus ventricosus TaxID=182803 RepID=A0A4Y2S5S7_ARAVE|nr:hypothetical protein AVEN_236471-1 [Araneus ventricosus]GBN83584.1 hypothetical protein AVEN_147923-1 [Araneus ventricosus]